MNTTLFSREHAQERSGGVWSYISASRLNAWLACPLRFRLKYIEGVREATSSPLFLGKVVHHGLEQYYRSRFVGSPLAADDVAGRVAASWGQLVAQEEMRFQSTGEERQCHDQALDLLRAYLRHVPSDEPRPLAVEAAVEAPLVDPLTGENLGIPFVGIMDLVLAEPSGPLIADFKTAARANDPLEIAYEIQLTSYAYLFRHATGQVEHGLEIRNLIKTRFPQIRFHRYERRGERHFQRWFAVIRAYLDSLDTGQFVYRPGRDCGMCAFRELQCREWQGT